MAYLFPGRVNSGWPQWSEFDLQAIVWDIRQPHEDARPHRIPLPGQAVDILRELHRLTGDGKGGLVFPSVRSVLRRSLRTR